VPELRSFILAMLQADTFGVSIGRMLRARPTTSDPPPSAGAGKGPEAPVKMLFPLIFCIFPSLSPSSSAPPCSRS